jgi:SH3-like domain-containing protein
MAVAALLAAPSAATGGPAAASCHISAYVNDQDPKGTNIRAAPSANGAVVKVLPAQVDAVAEITSHGDGWFRVSLVQETGDSDRILFHGSGWMHRSVLGLDVANDDPRLYAGPSKTSKITAKLVADGSLVTLIGCRGEWAQVRFGNRTGWLSPGGQCSSPLTTCS